MSGSPQTKNFTPAAHEPGGGRCAAAHGRLCPRHRHRPSSPTTSPPSTDAFSAGKTAMMLHVVDDRRPGLQPEDVEGGRTTSPSRSVPASGAAAARSSAAAGASASRRTPPNKDARLDGHHLPHARKEWGKFEVGREPDRSDPQLGLLRSRALNSKFPYLKTAGAGESSRHRSSTIANIPRDVRADHDRGRAVRGRAGRLVVGGGGLHEGATTAGSRSSSVAAISSSDAATAGGRDGRRVRTGRHAAARVSPRPPSGGARRCSCSARARSTWSSFSVYPLVASLGRSFHATTTSGAERPGRWIGLGNYRELFHEPRVLRQIVQNTAHAHVRRRRDPGRARHGARAVLQPAPARRRDRARDPRSCRCC